MKLDRKNTTAVIAGTALVLSLLLAAYQASAPARR